MELGLRGSRVVVTGASSGLGRAICEGFISEGAHVLACGRNPEHGVPAGAQGSVFVDLASPGGAEAVVEAARHRLGGIDTLVAAAGGAVRGSVASSSDEVWEAGLQVNLLGVIRLARAAIPMLTENGGRIVILGALSAREPRPHHVVSNVSKAGVTALAKTLSRELAADGVLVNCVAPGRIRSAQLDRSFPDDDSRRMFAEANIPLQRFGAAEEIVPVTLLLGSPLNTYITGQTVGVDGGMAWGA